jgi:carboxylesterase
MADKETLESIKNPHLAGDSFYWEAGPTGVLLIHGFTATTAEIRPLAEALHAKGYTVSGPLLPGHKTNPLEINRCSWTDWVETVEKAYQELVTRCDRVFIGGESMGGLLSLYLGIHHPQVAALLTYAPALKTNMRRMDVLRLYLMAPFIPYVPKPESDDDLAWQGYYVNPLGGVIQLLRLQRQVMPHLSSIRRPVLVIQGKLDTTVHPDVPEIIISQVSSNMKEVHWMDNSTHCVALDHEREQVFDLTLRFMERVQ